MKRLHKHLMYLCNSNIPISNLTNKDFTEVNVAIYHIAQGHNVGV